VLPDETLTLPDKIANRPDVTETLRFVPELTLMLTVPPPISTGRGLLLLIIPLDV
jgi:hypothetical protein